MKTLIICCVVAAQFDRKLSERGVHRNRIATRIGEAQRRERPWKRVGGAGPSGLECRLGHVLHLEGTASGLLEYANHPVRAERLRSAQLDSRVCGRGILQRLHCERGDVVT